MSGGAGKLDRIYLYFSVLVTTGPFRLWYPGGGFYVGRWVSCGSGLWKAAPGLIRLFVDSRRLHRTRSEAVGW
jgi:hypothetical protein